MPEDIFGPSIGIPTSPQQLPPAVISDSPVWASPSPLGSTKRAATDILMSTFDTDPTSADQTAAFQAAFASALGVITAGAQKVRIILDTRQKYQIAGAVTAGANGEWAQVALPYANKSIARGIVQLVGIPRGANSAWIYGQTSGTVIESTLGSAPTYSATTGIASIFGSTASFCTTHIGGTTAMNAIGFATQDVTIRSANPVICGIDAGFLDSFAFDGMLLFDTDAMASGGALAVCTSPQAIPVIFPFLGSARGTLGDTLVCSGWLGGPMLGEKATIKQIVAFCHAGASLNLDVATQVTHIVDLIEWNTAYGVATTAPTSATPIAPTTTGTASKSTAAFLASPVRIDNWTIQTTGSAPSIPVATNRVYDIMCGANADAVAVTCPSYNSTTDALVTTGAPIIFSNGSLTGFVSRVRVEAAYTRNYATSPQAVPATNTAVRNNLGRNCLVHIIGGTVSAVTVNGVAQAVTTPVLVAANGTIAITYTVAPTWSWEPV